MPHPYLWFQWKIKCSKYGPYNQCKVAKIYQKLFFYHCPPKTTCTILAIWDLPQGWFQPTSFKIWSLKGGCLFPWQCCPPSPTPQHFTPYSMGSPRDIPWTIHSSHIKVNLWIKYKDSVSSESGNMFEIYKSFTIGGSPPCPLHP